MPVRRALDRCPCPDDDMFDVWTRCMYTCQAGDSLLVHSKHILPSNTGMAHSPCLQTTAAIRWWSRPCRHSAEVRARLGSWIHMHKGEGYRRAEESARCHTNLATVESIFIQVRKNCPICCLLVTSTLVKSNAMQSCTCVAACCQWHLEERMQLTVITFTAIPFYCEFNTACT